MSNPLAAECPCGHPAFNHRTQEQIEANRADGRRYVGECTGRNPINNWCCQCQVERSQVIAASLVAKENRV